MGLFNYKAQDRKRPDCDPAVFDFLHFDEQTFGEESLQREILGLFETQLDDTSKSLAQPVSPTSWRYLTHTLKGAAAAIGATAIRNLASQWEAMEPPAKTAEVRATLLAAIAAFRHEVEKLHAA